MNKERLLAWAVHEVKVWPSKIDATLSIPPAPVCWVWAERFELGRREAILAKYEDGFYAQELTRDEWEAALEQRPFEPFVSVEDAPAPITAHSILEAAGGHMRDRAATYDKPEGERSMGATVEAFRAITGHKLTEEQGWLFMQLLKAVRSQQGAYRADSYEDGAAYVSLAGEAAARERGGAQ